MIRPATADDATPVAALERLLFGVDAWSEAQVVEELTGPGRRAWVDEGPDAPVGYLVTLLAGDVVDLLRVAVHPGARRHGRAAGLLAVAVAAAAADGAARMLLEVSEANTGARAFYAAHGFAEIARRRAYYRDGSDALVLQRVLAGHLPGATAQWAP